jgi:hypothetical protein
VHGSDGGLLAAVVPDRAPGGLDPADQRRLADEATAPDLVEQLGLGDHPVPVADQVDQDVEHLGLEALQHTITA